MNSKNQSIHARLQEKFEGDKPFTIDLIDMRMVELTIPQLARMIPKRWRAEILSGDDPESSSNPEGYLVRFLTND